MTAIQPPETRFALLIRVVFGTYCWAICTVVISATLVALLLLPGVNRRRHLTGVVARLLLKLMGMGLKIYGAEHLPLGQSIVVANHASYIDAIIIKAVLPERFVYVVKREMESFPLAGLLLRRLGTEFVERFNRHKGGRDAKRVLQTAANGQSLLFFPEGTFTEVIGILKFHNGAFVIATQANCPVVPCVIRGSRHILPSPYFFPRPGTLEVELLAPLYPAIDLPPARAASQLRDMARALIVARTGEPDLML